MLGHRVVWSALTMTIVVVALHQVAALRALLADRRRTALLLAAAAVTITVNWGVYIYGVTHDRVVETALGYYINPLVTVLLGVLVLGERMRRLQWVALGDRRGRRGGAHRRLRATALGGDRAGALLRQLRAAEEDRQRRRGAEPDARDPLHRAGRAGLPRVPGQQRRAPSSATTASCHALLLTTTGVVTAVPLLCFGAAATRIPLTTIGLLQYLTPTLQFLLGVLYFREDMPAARWVGFALVWIALVIFTFEALRHRRRQLRLAPWLTAAAGRRRPSRCGRRRGRRRRPGRRGPGPAGSTSRWRLASSACART